MGPDKTRCAGKTMKTFKTDGGKTTINIDGVPVLTVPSDDVAAIRAAVRGVPNRLPTVKGGANQQAKRELRNRLKAAGLM